MKSWPRKSECTPEHENSLAGPPSLILYRLRTRLAALGFASIRRCTLWLSSLLSATSSRAVLISSILSLGSLVSANRLVRTLNVSTKSLNRSTSSEHCSSPTAKALNLAGEIIFVHIRVAPGRRPASECASLNLKRGKKRLSCLYS